MLFGVLCLFVVVCNASMRYSLRDCFVLIASYVLCGVLCHVPCSLRVVRCGVMCDVCRLLLSIAIQMVPFVSCVLFVVCCRLSAACCVLFDARCVGVSC